MVRGLIKKHDTSSSLAGTRTLASSTIYPRDSSRNAPYQVRPWLSYERHEVDVVWIAHDISVLLFSLKPSPMVSSSRRNMIVHNVHQFAALHNLIYPHDEKVRNQPVDNSVGFDGRIIGIPSLIFNGATSTVQQSVRGRGTDGACGKMWGISPQAATRPRYSL